MAENTNTSNAGGNNGSENPETTGTTTETTTETGKTKVVFSDEQQEWLESWGNKMFAKGRTKAEGEVKTQYESQITSLSTEVSTLKTALAEATKTKEEATTSTGKKAASEEVTLIKAQLEELQENLKALRGERDTYKGTAEKAAAELDTLRSRDKESRKASEFRQAASGLNFIDTDEVYELVKSQLGEDENGDVVVMNPKTGRPRINKEGENMSLSEYLTTYATQKPHLVKANETAGGTGAGPSRSATNASTGNKNNPLGVSVEEIQDMTPAEFEKHKAALMAKARRR